MSSKITWKWLNFTVQYFIIFGWQTTNHYYVQIIGNATSTFYIQKFHFTFRVYCCLFLFHSSDSALRTKKKQIRSLVINAICETLAHEHFFHAKFQVLCLLCISIYLNLYTYIMFQCNIIIFTLEVELFHVNYLVFKRSFGDFCMRSNKQNNMFEHWIYVIK